MNIFADRRRILAAVGVFLAVALVASGIWFLARRDGGAGPPQPPAGQPAPSATLPASPSPTPALMIVKVYFHRGDGSDPDTVVALDRTVPKTPMVATAALGQLLAGPTVAERQAGYWSLFSAATSGMLRSVRIGNGVAHADLRDMRRVIPNASSSAGSAALLSELNATLKQFAAVRATVYSFNGNVAAFYEWLQMSPPYGMPPSPAEARGVAETFLTRVAGMDNLVDQAFRWTGSDLAEVDFRVRFEESGHPLAGPVTTVMLRQDPTAWRVIGARTDTISVASPARMQAITSPVTVSGSALAYEATVNVSVVQVTGTTLRALGEDYVMGGGDVIRPFIGTVDFVQPSANTGWVLFYEVSPLNGEIAKLTAVQVAFAGVPAPPQIAGVTMAPSPAVRSGWVMLTGAGRITFTVRTRAATKVQLYLTPLTNGVVPTPALLGTATRSGDVFSYPWRYRDEPLLAQLSIVATNANGRTELVPFNAYHP